MFQSILLLTILYFKSVCAGKRSDDEDDRVQANVKVPTQDDIFLRPPVGTYLPTSNERKLQALDVLVSQLTTSLNSIHLDDDNYANQILQVFDTEFKIDNYIQASDHGTVFRINNTSYDTPSDMVKVFAPFWKKFKTTGEATVDFTTRLEGEGGFQGIVVSINGPTHFCTLYMTVNFHKGADASQGRRLLQDDLTITDEVTVLSASESPGEKPRRSQAESLATGFCKQMRKYPEFAGLCQRGSTEEINDAALSPDNSAIIEEYRRRHRFSRERRTQSTPAEMESIYVNQGLKLCADTSQLSSRVKYFCDQGKYKKALTAAAGEEQEKPADSMSALGRHQVRVKKIREGLRPGPYSFDPTSAGRQAKISADYLECLVSNNTVDPDDPSCVVSAQLFIEGHINSVQEGLDADSTQRNRMRNILASSQYGMTFTSSPLAFTFNLDFGVISCSATVPLSDAWGDGCAPQVSCSGGAFTLSGSICVQRGDPVISLQLQYCNTALQALDDALVASTSLSLENLGFQVCQELGSLTYYHGIQTFVITVTPPCLTFTIFQFCFEAEIELYLKGRPSYSAFSSIDIVPHGYTCQADWMGPSNGGDMGYVKRGMWTLEACKCECDENSACAYFDFIAGGNSDDCRLYYFDENSLRSANGRQLCRKISSCFDRTISSEIGETNFDCGGPNCAPCYSIGWVRGYASSNTCPSGSQHATETECKTGNKFVGDVWYLYQKSQSQSDYPKACRKSNSGQLFFNTHPTGAARSDSEPYCKVTSPPAKWDGLTCYGSTQGSSGPILKSGRFGTLQQCLNWCYTFVGEPCAAFDFDQYSGVGSPSTGNCRLYGAIAAQTSRPGGGTKRTWCKLAATFPNAPVADLTFTFKLKVGCGLSFINCWTTVFQLDFPVSFGL